LTHFPSLLLKSLLKNLHNHVEEQFVRKPGAKEHTSLGIQSLRFNYHGLVGLSTIFEIAEIELDAFHFRLNELANTGMRKLFGQFTILIMFQMTIIPRTSPVTVLSAQGAKEQRALAARIAKLGPIYNDMHDYLESVAACSHKRFTRKFLHDLALDIIRVMELPGIDRLASRKKDAMICWYCEHCPFLPRIPEYCRMARAIPVPVNPPQGQAPANPTPQPQPPAHSIMNWRDWDDRDEFSDLTK
jgi:hypothetical protein